MEEGGRKIIKVTRPRFGLLEIEPKFNSPQNEPKLGSSQNTLHHRAFKLSHDSSPGTLLFFPKSRETRGTRQMKVNHTYDYCCAPRCIVRVA